MSPQQIIGDYYAELQQAFVIGTIDFAKMHFDEHISVIGPNERFDGKKAVEDMYRQFILFVDHFDITRQYVDGESVCTVMDCVVNLPPYHIATIEWILVRNNKIVEIHPVYDTLAWHQAVQALQNKS